MFSQKTKRAISSVCSSLWTVPVVGLLVACGGVEPENASNHEWVTNDEDALRASQITGDWFLDADTAAAQVRFAECSLNQGCDSTGWRSAQAVFDALCTKTNGRICITLSDISREATIVATREYTARLILHAEEGDKSVPGVTVPNHPRAIFGNAGAIWAASSYDPALGALGNASILDLTFSSADEASGILQLAFGAALLVGDQAGAGVVTIRMPVTVARLR